MKTSKLSDIIVASAISTAIALAFVACVFVTARWYYQCDSHGWTYVRWVVWYECVKPN